MAPQFAYRLYYLVVRTAIGEARPTSRSGGRGLGGAEILQCARPGTLSQRLMHPMCARHTASQEQESKNFSLRAPDCMMRFNEQVFREVKPKDFRGRFGGMPVDEPADRLASVCGE